MNRWSHSTLTPREETAQGTGGLEIRAGTRHFAPGAKVWALPPQWGDGGEKLLVVGRHRGSVERFIRIVIFRRHLTRFRVRALYSPAVLRAVQRPGRRGGWTPRLWTGLAEAEEAVAQWSIPALDASFDDSPYSATVTDPPPPTVHHRDKIYHLAHFNAYRARYSAQPPPVEQPPPAAD